MELLIPSKLTPSNVSLWQDDNLIIAFKDGIQKNYMDMSLSPPAHVYEFVKNWTGLGKHDFQLKLEYPPFHKFHPKGRLPEVLGEVRKPYLHTFE